MNNFMYLLEGAIQKRAAVGAVQNFQTKPKFRLYIYLPIFVSESDIFRELYQLQKITRFMGRPWAYMPHYVGYKFAIVWIDLNN